MAIDYSIDYDCVPKQTFGTDEIIERLKGRERAELIIRMYRDQDDMRPPSEMGFEFTRSTPQGQEETTLIVVQDLLDQAAELERVAHHCAGCPANRLGRPFGCCGFIQYPLSGAGEAWLLNQLPTPDDALVWLLLKRGIEDFQYDGANIAHLRRSAAIYFEDQQAPVRRLGEFSINADQLFEMLFAVGDIVPNHAGVLLLFLHAIPRDLQADEIMGISPAKEDAEARYPFRYQAQAEDDVTSSELKEFLHALYTSWRLNVPLRIDA